MYPSTYFLAQRVLAEMKGENKTASAISQELARAGFNSRRINVNGGSLVDIVHPSSEYTIISRAWSTSDLYPDVLFIDALNVAGSRMGISGRVGFSVQVTCDGSGRDIIEDHGTWKERISPELRALEGYLFARRENELIYTYRCVKAIR